MPNFSKSRGMNTTQVQLSFFKRTKFSSCSFVLLLSLCNTVLFHYPLAVYSLENIDYHSAHGMRTLLTLVVIVFVITAVFLFAISLLSTLALKVFAISCVLGSSVAFYFIITYQVILDRSMMGNVFNTKAVESSEFLHPKLLLFFIILGLLPTFLIIKIKVGAVRRLRALSYTLLLVIFCLLFIYVNGSTALWFDKHSRKLGGVMLPWSYIINSARVHIDRLNENVEPTLLPMPTVVDKRKTVVVLVIGETARANNFSIYGYGRNTNPLLVTSGAVALQNVKACSTYTTASIHCM